MPFLLSPWTGAYSLDPLGEAPGSRTISTSREPLPRRVPHGRNTSSVWGKFLALGVRQTLDPQCRVTTLVIGSAQDRSEVYVEPFCSFDALSGLATGQGSVYYVRDRESLSTFYLKCFEHFHVSALGLGSFLSTGRVPEEWVACNAFVTGREESCLMTRWAEFKIDADD